jgi:hypothetical protein
MDRPEPAGYPDGLQGSPEPLRGGTEKPPPHLPISAHPREIYLDAQKILANLGYLTYLTYPQGGEG